MSPVAIFTMKPKSHRKRKSRRGSRRLPFQRPLLLYGDNVSRGLEWLLKRLNYDDALVCGKWRLEYLQLEYGLTHYRLYRRGRLIGVKDIRSRRLLPVIQRDLAAFLAGIGFTRDRCRLVVYGAARTPLDANKHRIGQLWCASYDKNKKRKKNGSRRQVA